VWLVAQNPSQTPTGSGEPSTSSEFSAEAPWRLVIADNIQQNDQGCFVRLLNETSEEVWKNTVAIYGTGENIYQMHNSGNFRWTVNDSGCTVVHRSGSPLVKLPTSVPCCRGDSAAFKAPESVMVQVKDFAGSSTCKLELHDLADGSLVDYGIATQNEKETVALQTSGRSEVYLGDLKCGVSVSAG